MDDRHYSPDRESWEGEGVEPAREPPRLAVCPECGRQVRQDADLWRCVVHGPVQPVWTEER